MKYLKKIIGKGCYLAPMNEDDFELCAEWFNDMEIAVGIGEAGCHYTYVNSKDMMDAFCKREHYFTIVESEKNAPIGICWLKNVNTLERNAEIVILIGNKNYLGKGYGEESINLLLDYSFNIINLNNIMLSVYAFNKRAIKCYEKCGFKIFGVRRKSFTIGKKSYDEVYMDIMADEFTKESVVTAFISEQQA